MSTTHDGGEAHAPAPAAGDRENLHGRGARTRVSGALARLLPHFSHMCRNVSVAIDMRTAGGRPMAPMTPQPLDAGHAHRLPCFRTVHGAIDCATPPATRVLRWWRIGGFWRKYPLWPNPTCLCCFKNFQTLKSGRSWRALPRPVA